MSVNQPIVEIAQGKLAGSHQDGALRFAGIPFAKPPVGALRWHLCEPPEPWTGTRDATRFGFIAVQEEKQNDILKGPPGAHSEDCLYLNIWTPACDAARRPVMVWIHGGGFTAGASNIGAYDGAPLARRGDVVVVTINYRLGAFGFLNLHDASGGTLPGSGAEGIADQIAALAWVNQNIAAFGGDPDNVTAFGESAGSASVCALMASPKARGLFHKAICESGGAHVGKSREESVDVARALLEKLGAKDQPERVLRATHEEILQAQMAVVASPPTSAGRLSFGPVIDGDILPVRAIDAIRAGSAKGIALLAGTARDEAKIMFVGDPKSRTLDSETLTKRVMRLVGEERATHLLAAYDEATPADALMAIVGDNTFLIPMIKLLEAQSVVAPTFGYRIDWPSRLLGGAVGACHVIEIGFVFGTYARDDVAYFFGTGAEADALSHAMMDCWIEFARSGNPSTKTLDWPRYDAAKRTTMIFGDGAPHAVSDPASSRRLAWEKLPEKQLGL